MDGGTLIFTNTREQCDKLADTLTFLHNLTHSLSSGDVGIGGDLCCLGLELSSAALQLAAIRMYLGIGLKSGYLTYRL